MDEPLTKTIIAKIIELHIDTYTTVVVFDQTNYNLKTLTILPNWDISVEKGRLYCIEVEFVRSGESTYFKDGEELNYKYTASYVRNCIPYNGAVTGKLKLS